MEEMEPHSSHQSGTYLQKKNKYFHSSRMLLYLISNFCLKKILITLSVLLSWTSNVHKIRYCGFYAISDSNTQSIYEAI